MFRKSTQAIIVLTAFLLFTSLTLPTQAWVYPNGSEDGRFELYGPHTSGILIKLYENLADELLAMDNDLLDFEDFALPTEWVNKWQNDSRFQLKNDGGETGFYILDINKNGDPVLPDGSPNPAYIAGLGNPCSVLEFRKALAYMVNRTYIINNILSGYGLPIWTPMPAYMTTYIHPDIKPSQALENLTYGGMQGNTVAATAILAEANFIYNASEYPWRFWDKNKDGHYQSGEEFSLIFYARYDHKHRYDFAVDYAQRLRSEPVNLNIDLRTPTRIECHDNVMEKKRFHIFTGGWMFIGPDPEYLYDLYHSSMYWHPGRPPNYCDGHDDLLDHYAEELKFAPNMPYGTQMTLKFQERFASLVWSIPLWSASNFKVYRRIPVEEPGSAQWLGVVNQIGFGINSYWTFLNLMKECEYYPPIYVTYGFSTSTIDSLNPLYAEWYWDWEVLDKIYDTCASRNPYSPGEWIPQLAKSWEVSTWKDFVTGTNKVKIHTTLRPNLYWQDGTPITVADLIYSYVECAGDLIAKGLGPPIWWPMAQFFKSHYILDPLTVEFLIDDTSIWAVNWVLDMTIFPRHIWKPIVDSSSPSNPIAKGHQPDPNCIGSGSFRFVQYIPYDKVELVANTPGSVVNGITSPGYWQYCPIHVNIKTENFRVKLDPGFPNTAKLFNFSASLHNLWLNQSTDGVLIVSKYVYVDNNLIEEKHGISLLSCHLEEELFGVLLTKCTHSIKVAVHVDGPAFLDGIHANPWICQWINVTLPLWITIKQDVGGTLYDGVVVVPDCKVDGKDIAFVSSAFNTVPGVKKWNSAADVTGDYRVDGKDLANIARYFGKW